MQAACPGQPWDAPQFTRSRALAAFFNHRQPNRPCSRQSLHAAFYRFDLER
jgi:hypothetical protein